MVAWNLPMAILTVTDVFALDTRTFTFGMFSYREFLFTSPTFYSDSEGFGFWNDYRGSGFTYDASDRFSGGTIASYKFSADADAGAEGSILVAGLAVSAAAVAAAVATATKADDLALVRAALAQHDLFTGASGNDFVRAGGGGDTLRGNGGKDTLLGQDGNDILSGGTQADVLIGGAGNDRLIGGPGIDTVFGGVGNDAFILKAPVSTANRDAIKDFANAPGNNDSILLAHSVMPALGAAGALDPQFFFAGAAAHDADDHIVYNRSTGTLFYDPDGNVPGNATAIATLTTRPLLTAADFLVI